MPVADSPASRSLQIKVEQPLERLGHPARGNLGRQAAEADAVAFRTAADHDEVLRNRLAADLAHAALEAQARRCDGGRTRSGSR